MSQYAIFFLINNSAPEFLLKQPLLIVWATVFGIFCIFLFFSFYYQTIFLSFFFWFFLPSLTEFPRQFFDLPAMRHCTFQRVKHPCLFETTIYHDTGFFVWLGSSARAACRQLSRRPKQNGQQTISSSSLTTLRRKDAVAPVAVASCPCATGFDSKKTRVTMPSLLGVVRCKLA